MVPVLIYKILDTILGIIRSWWWIIPPIILYKPLLYLWLYWRQNLWAEELDFILLEIKIPEEVKKPLKAMENVFAGLWPLYDAPNWKEKWIKGEFLLSLSFEVVSINGEPHFFIRTPDFYRNTVESSIYSQYPDAEIEEVPDYTEQVPDEIPNEEWDLWGTDYEMIKPDVYPIKTYADFFEERPDTKEEKRLDPLANLLEGLSRMKKGEQIWVQILATPVTNETGWIEKGERIRDELVGRETEEPKKSKSILREVIELILKGPTEEEEEEESGGFLSPEMRLTSGEKQKVTGIENKISKYGYHCNIRFLYLAKRDVFFKPNVKLPLSFFTQFSTQNLNALKPWPKTITKVTYFFPERRVHHRKRRIFRMYKHRLPPLYPKPGGRFMLNLEELATIYHFPGREVASAPFMKRTEIRKGEAPPELPTE